jgi:hypothetical protein
MTSDASKIWRDTASLTSSATRTPAPEGEAVTVWYGKMPESNGRENWTASLRRVNSTDPWGQEFCFARSEYPDRVRYEADRVRWIIGELPERPDILAYDADKHSGYVPPASPVVPVGVSNDELAQRGQVALALAGYRTLSMSLDAATDAILAALRPTETGTNHD